MQLPLTPPVVLAALLVSAPAGAAGSDALSPEVDPPEIDGVAVVDQLPPTSPCPAYLGPQCDSVEHEQWVTGQDIAELATDDLGGLDLGELGAGELGAGELGAGELSAGELRAGELAT
ncbi:hypothetical protein [Pseudonocardia sp. TRM90224]|uniref:hypothetical protein n=1 Tax=Pseudonocardia sp. TRM90224 TaxID=2812678 RepID=UPI001E63EE9B|nr:hypothetical protein [Pseudonocardia sp. TRM90224]